MTGVFRPAVTPNIWRTFQNINSQDSPIRQVPRGSRSATSTAPSLLVMDEEDLTPNVQVPGTALTASLTPHPFTPFSSYPIHLPAPVEGTTIPTSSGFQFERQPTTFSGPGSAPRAVSLVKRARIQSSPPPPEPVKGMLPTRAPSVPSTLSATLMDRIIDLRRNLAANQAQVALLTKALAAHITAPPPTPIPKGAGPATPPHPSYASAATSGPTPTPAKWQTAGEK